MPIRPLHRLTAVDKTTDGLAHQFDLEGDQLAAIGRVVDVPAAYLEKYGALPLCETDIRRIAEGGIDLPVPLAAYEWFLEPSSVPDPMDDLTRDALRSTRPIPID